MQRMILVKRKSIIVLELGRLFSQISNVFPFTACSQKLFHLKNMFTYTMASLQIFFGMYTSTHVYTYTANLSSCWVTGQFFPGSRGVSLSIFLSLALMLQVGPGSGYLIRLESQRQPNVMLAASLLMAPLGRSRTFSWILESRAWWGGVEGHRA